MNNEIDESPKKSDETVRPSRRSGARSKRTEKATFFRLDTSKRYEVLGGESQSNGTRFVLLLFPILFLSFLAFMVIISFKTLIHDLESILAASFIFLIGMFFLIVFGRIAHQSKKTARRERAIILGDSPKMTKKRKRDVITGGKPKMIGDKPIITGCKLTNGKVTNCDARIRRSSSKNNGTSYNVALTYSFFDGIAERTNTINFVQGTKPIFPVGQNVMVAFTESDSLILSKFSLYGDDQEKFNKAEEARARLDFQGLTGATVSVSKSKKLKSEMHKEIIAAYAILGFDVLITGILLLATLGIDPIVTVIVSIVPSVPLLPIGLYILISELKRKHLIKKMLKSTHYFTYANVGLSKQVQSHTLFYCYVDNNGNRRRKKVRSLYLNSTMRETTERMLVIYNDKNQSVLLAN